MYDKLCMEGGNVVSRPYVDFAFTVDERISDGYYFARTLDVFKEIILDPEVLEKPLSEEGVPV
jgi:pyruvate/2-oxoglutarate dehydrogenase complex dihydrolipoamide acyltransferase (E2) component